MSAIPPPTWPLTTGENITRPWYGYLKAADETWRNKVTNFTSLSTVSDPTASLLSNHGVSMINSVPATSTLLIAAPVPGCKKTICITSTSSTGKVGLQSTAHFFRNQSTVAGTTGWTLVFSSTAPYKAVELLGISTSEYLIVSNIGSVVVATV